MAQCTFKKCSFLHSTVKYDPNMFFSSFVRFTLSPSGPCFPWSVCNAGGPIEVHCQNSENLCHSQQKLSTENQSVAVSIRLMDRKDRKRSETITLLLNLVHYVYVLTQCLRICCCTCCIPVHCVLDLFLHAVDIFHLKYYN